MEPPQTVTATNFVGFEKNTGKIKNFDRRLNDSIDRSPAHLQGRPALNAQLASLAWTRMKGGSAGVRMDPNQEFLSGTAFPDAVGTHRLAAGRARMPIASAQRGAAETALALGVGKAH